MSGINTIIMVSCWYSSRCI